MARPRKFYIIYEIGRAVRITEGRPLNYVGTAFSSRQAAEEYAAWWNYESAQERPHLFPEVTRAQHSPASAPFRHSP